MNCLTAEYLFGLKSAYCQVPFGIACMACAYVLNYIASGFLEPLVEVTVMLLQTICTTCITIVRALFALPVAIQI